VPDTPLQPPPGAAPRRRLLIIGAAATVTGAGALAACGSGDATSPAPGPAAAGVSSDPAGSPPDVPSSDAGAPPASEDAADGSTTGSTPAKAAEDFSRGALAKLSSVPEGGSAIVAGIAVGRPSAKKVVGHSQICTHAGCKVEAAGTALNCPCHGSVFDAFTGAVQQGPAQQPLTAVKLVVKGDYIHRA